MAENPSSTRKPEPARASAVAAASLPFVYLELDDVLRVGPIRSKSPLYREIRLGRAPAPDNIGGRSLWRSDRIAEWIRQVAAEAESRPRARSARFENTLARRAVRSGARTKRREAKAE